jgi:hypothetical protein
MDEVALRFPLPSLIPPAAPHSSSIMRGWYNRPNSGRRAEWTQSHPQKLKKKKNLMQNLDQDGDLVFVRREENEKRHTKISALDSDPRTLSRMPQLYSHTYNTILTNTLVYLWGHILFPFRTRTLQTRRRQEAITRERERNIYSISL